MVVRRPALLESRAEGLRIVHRPELRPELVVQAIELHRANAALGREHCEHWGPGSSVSHVVLRGDREHDLAVKWNHPRGLRGGLSDTLHGSRAARAAAGASTLAVLGLPHPEYAHVPLVMEDDGERLSKRTGSVTLEGLAEQGIGPERVVSWIGSSLNLCSLDDHVSLAELLASFDWGAVPAEPVATPLLARPT